MPNKVFVTREIPQEGLDILNEADLEVVVSSQKGVISREDLLEGVKGVDALLPLLTDTIDAEVMDAAGDQLKVIAHYAVGYNNIDVKAAAERDIIVTNTPGVLTQAVAEHSVALMMAVTNKILAADKFVRSGEYKGWDPDLFVGYQFHRKVMGIVGAGRIGYTTAKIAREGLDMMVHYSNPSPNEVFDKEFGAKHMSLEEVLKTSDFVSIHVPLLPDTIHLIGEEQLKMMKKSAFLINTARGPIVDEKALVEALQKKEIEGAALDVFEEEPKLASGLAELDNVVLTPHIASATFEARAEMATLAARNVVAVLSEKRPISPVK